MTAVRRYVISVGLFAAIGFTIGVAWFRWSGSRSADTSVVDLPSGDHRRFAIVSCDPGVVWLWAWGRAPRSQVDAQGVTAAIAAQRSSILRLSSGAGARDATVGEGLLVAFARADRDVLWAVLRERYGLPGERSRTYVSTDGGASWQERSAPEDVIGLAFESSRRGYAWSETEIYATDDGGVQWRQVSSVKPFHLGRGTGDCRPVLGAGGELWLPLNKASSDGVSLPAPPTARLSIVKPDRASEDVLTWASEEIRGIAPQANGGALVAVTPLTSVGITIVRVAPDGSLTSVDASSNVSAAEFASKGTLVLLHEVAFDVHAKPFDDPPQSIVLSSDSGATWARRDMTSEAVDSVCLAESGFWTLSGRHRRVVFHAVPTR